MNRVLAHVDSETCQQDVSSDEQGVLTAVWVTADSDAAACHCYSRPAGVNRADPARPTVTFTTSRSVCRRMMAGAAASVAASSRACCRAALTESLSLLHDSGARAKTG